MGVTASQVLQFIAASPSKVDFAGLKRHFHETHQESPKQLKLLIGGLIQAGRLCYTFHYGRSFIEIAFDRPWVASEHVIIKPPRHSLSASPDQWVVSLGRGAAFGGGEHPTTRLAIQLIDLVLHRPYWRDKKQSLRAIDIGTGSGVLAIVAAKIGVGLVCGTDTDPCAVFEARDNVRLNRLEDRVNIIEDALEDIPGPYDLVFANLRTPTLFEIRDNLDKKVAADSMLIFSGLKTDEAGSICAYYEEAGFLILQIRSEKGWSAIRLTRGAFSNEGVGPMS